MEERCNNEEGSALPDNSHYYLEQNFRLNHILNPDQKAALATELNLKQRQVEVRFQNRRARSKVKQKETEFEYLKRWVVSLTEQNKRLQQEVEDLRTVRVGPSRGVLSLTMCPGCKCVTTASASMMTTDVSSTTANEAFLLPRKPAICHNS